MCWQPRATDTETCGVSMLHACKLLSLGYQQTYFGSTLKTALEYCALSWRSILFNQRRFLVESRTSTPEIHRKNIKQVCIEMKFRNERILKWFLAAGLLACLCIANIRIMYRIRSQGIHRASGGYGHFCREFVRRATFNLIFWTIYLRQCLQVKTFSFIFIHHWFVSKCFRKTWSIRVKRKWTGLTCSSSQRRSFVLFMWYQLRLVCRTWLRASYVLQANQISFIDLKQIILGVGMGLSQQEIWTQGLPLKKINLPKWSSSSPGSFSDLSIIFMTGWLHYGVFRILKALGHFQKCRGCNIQKSSQSSRLDPP